MVAIVAGIIVAWRLWSLLGLTPSPLMIVAGFILGGVIWVGLSVAQPALRERLDARAAARAAAQ